MKFRSCSKEAGSVLPVGLCFRGYIKVLSYLFMSIAWTNFVFSSFSYRIFFNEEASAI
jgi:hypothetical protein